MELLFVEDDEMIAAGLVYALTQEGYHVTHCLNMHTALEKIAGCTFAIAILDMSLPDGSGYDLCKMLKEKQVAVVFLTAVDDEGNVVMGLEMGADDYITKPFRVRELMARLGAVLRRQGTAETPKPNITMGNVEINTAKAKVYRSGVEVELTALEYRLLLVFAANKGRVLSRGQLLEGIWDVAGSFVNDNTVTVYIKRLREKLEEDSQNPKLITTVRGIGYIVN